MSRSTHLSRTRVTTAVCAALALVAACGGAPAGQMAATPDRSRDSVQVGYGTQAKRDITGAIGSVDGVTARQTTATSLADLLEGRVPGLEVRRLSSGGLSIHIRGVRSINGPGEPLWVVDGMPIEIGASGAVPDLNPLDIKSIDVLKDAGSLAAYGSRGANGVILVTTKR